LRRRFSISTKFFLTYFVITGAALAFAGMAGYIQFKRYVIEEADQSLRNQAVLVAETFRPLLAESGPDLERIAREGDRLGKNLDHRLTIILPDGEVVADSEAGSAHLGDLENHGDRPEVRDALSGRTAFFQRRSITIKEEQRYCAVPILLDGKVIGVARTALFESSLTRRLHRVRVITWGTGIVAFLLMLAGTAVRARRITGPIEEIRKAALEFSSGDRSRRLYVRTGDELEDVAAALNQTAVQLTHTLSQLDKEKARLATLLENLSEGVIVVSDGRTVRMINREAARILGISTPPREGQPYTETIRHPDILRFIDGWKQGLEIPPVEIALHAAGHETTVRISGTSVPYAPGPGMDLLFTLRDTTEEKRLVRIKSDFVSNASHELRTPLTTILGYLEAMQDAAREGGAPDPSFLAIAHANALRMKQLIEDLLELSLAESGTVPPGREEIRLSALLDRIGAIHGKAAERAGKTLSVAGEDARFSGDQRTLLLALSNLVDNAVKYGKAGGSIRVTGAGEEGSVRIEVEDDGPGIAPDHLQRIFERFYRVDKGRSRDLGGTGLGLSIARHIVESHGGTIRAESRPGVGTRFTVRIPRESDGG